LAVACCTVTVFLFYTAKSCVLGLSAFYCVDNARDVYLTGDPVR